MPEEEITDADIERMKAAFERYNAGEFDALRDLFSPDIVMDRVGNLPPIQGWEAFRELQEPDAFEWQTLEPLDWTVNGDKVLLHTRIRSKGALSGMVLELDGWMVCTVADHTVVHMGLFTEEAEARAAAGLGQNDSP